MVVKFVSKVIVPFKDLELVVVSDGLMCEGSVCIDSIPCSLGIF